MWEESCEGERKVYRRAIKRRASKKEGRSICCSGNRCLIIICPSLNIKTLGVSLVDPSSSQSLHRSILLGDAGSACPVEFTDPSAFLPAFLFYKIFLADGNFD